VDGQLARVEGRHRGARELPERQHHDALEHLGVGPGHLHLLCGLVPGLDPAGLGHVRGRRHGEGVLASTHRGHPAKYEDHVPEQVLDGEVGARRRTAQLNGVDPGDGFTTEGDGAGQADPGIGVVPRCELAWIVRRGVCHDAIFCS
jgi:hypothetical protein